MRDTRGTHSHFSKILFMLMATLMLLGVTALDAWATHFRGQSISWTRVTGNTVDISVRQGWRDAFSTTIIIRDAVTNSVVTSFNMATPANSVGSFNDLNGEGYQIYENSPPIRVNLPHAGPFRAELSSCCRISTLVNAADNSYRVRTFIDLRNGQQGGVNSALPFQLQMAPAVNSVQIPVSDLDTANISCRMATSAESGISSIASTGSGTLSVSSDCVLNWNATTAAHKAKYAVQVIMTEGGTDTALDFIIEINGSLGSAPECTVNGSDALTVPVGVPVVVSVSATDPESANMTVNALGLPAGSTLSPASGSSITSGSSVAFNWTPAAPTNAAVSLIFTDPTFQTATCGFSVTAINALPIADAGPDQLVDENTLITLDGSGSSETGGNPLTYSWVQVSGPQTISLTGANTVNPTFTAPSVTSNEVYEFELTVENPFGRTDTDTVEITVQNANDPPVADAGPDQTVEATSPTGASVTLDGSGSSDPDGDPLTYVWSGDASGTGVSLVVNLSLGLHTVTLTVNDGELSSSDTVNILVQDTTPPTITTSDLTVEATGPATNVDIAAVTSASDDVGVVSLTPSTSGPFPLGSTTVTWEACDAAGNCSTATQVVTVEDTTAPTIAMSCEGQLWPPNHKLVSAVSGSASDLFGVNVSITVSSDQPANDTGDGNTDSDWEVVQNGDSWEVSLRAERKGNFDGPRTYTVDVSAADDSGNTATETCSVVVPHDQRGKKK